jgi:glutamate--cysteine ligase
VANFGRKPNVELNQNGESILLQEWAMEIMEAIEPICEILDADNPDKPYLKALEQQQRLVENPDLTPSAQILAGMSKNKQCFGDFGVTASTKYEAYFKDRELDAAQMQEFQQMAVTSLQEQKALEANDKLGLDDFLAHYFAQY